MSKLPDLFREIELKQGEIDALRPIDPERMGRVMQKFRLDWNFHSNHIEGNSLTYGETKSFLLHGITADGKPFRDHLDIKGNPCFRSQRSLSHEPELCHPQKAKEGLLLQP